MPDLLPEFDTSDRYGATDEFSGSVGTSSILVPSVAGNRIEELVIRCAVDQANNRRLEWSFDNTNWKRLRVGEWQAFDPRGDLTQIRIRAAGSGVTSVDYEIIMNLGQN